MDPEPTDNLPDLPEAGIPLFLPGQKSGVVHDAEIHRSLPPHPLDQGSDSAAAGEDTGEIDDG